MQDKEKRIKERGKDRAVERSECERRRENATKGLMKREDREEEASIKQNGASVIQARRRG